MNTHTLLFYGYSYCTIFLPLLAFNVVVEQCFLDHLIIIID